MAGPINGICRLFMMHLGMYIRPIFTMCTNYTNLKAVPSYYVLTLDGGIFKPFGTQKERNLR